MIQDWNLDNLFSAIRNRICELEKNLADYRIIDIENDTVKYKIPGGRCTPQIVKDFNELRIIKHRLKEVL